MKTITTCAYLICTALAGAYGSHEVAFAILMLLVVLDTIAGTIKHFALGKWMSRGMAVGVFVKTILYIGCPMIVHSFVSTYLGYEPANVNGILAAVLTLFSVAEGVSIIQNLIVAKTKDEKYSETDTITMLLSLAKKTLSRLFTFLIAKLEKKTIQE